MSSWWLLRRHAFGACPRRSSLFPSSLVLWSLVLWSLATPLSAQVWGEVESERPTAKAVRTSEPIVIDGVLDEAAWFSAPAITDLIQIVPDEGEPQTERTEIRILYDDFHLYVGGWFYDRGELTPRLTRRDTTWPDGDSFSLFLDTYHDHRTAYRFTVNPSGAIRDEIITGGGTGFGPSGGGRPGGGGPPGTGYGDMSWNPVWEVQTSVTEEGWFAEIKIPFSQLRYASTDVQLWGMQLDRRIGRLLEYSTWAFTPTRARATIARFGHLEGISGIRSSGRLEVLPFVVGRAEARRVARSGLADFDNPFRSGSDFFADGGADLKYRLSSNFTLDGTVNPDFGQVEVDPADINLTAFETRLAERRPFFVEGAEIFRFGESGGVERTYTRRIGRTLSAPDSTGFAYVDAPGVARILGAAKVTGKTSGGWSVGLLEALTNREVADFVRPGGERIDQVIEPMTNYMIGRARRDSAEGRSSVGFLATAVNRRFPRDSALRDREPASAYMGGIDFGHETSDRAWRLSGDFTPSYVTGAPGAILRLQRTSARYYQRPDATHVTYDPDATSLAGYAGKLELSKQAGQWRGGATLNATSPGYEVNDLGFQLNADRIDVLTKIGYEQPRPGLFRRWNAGIDPSFSWNFAGDAIAASAGGVFSAELLNYTGFDLSFGRIFESWNDRLTRGGPLTREPAGLKAGVGLLTDRRKPITLRVAANLQEDDEDSRRFSANATVGIRASPSREFRIGPRISVNDLAAQYVTSVADPLATHTFGRRYVFAALEQTTFSIDLRANINFNPRLTLEVFAEPFISTGRYVGLKELARPRSFEFVDFTTTGSVGQGTPGRVLVDPDGPGPALPFQVNNLNFNYRSLLGNAVLRWEWRPGSTLFLVWQQSRAARLTAALADGPDLGQFDLEKETRAMLGLRPENVLTIKVNYWMSP